MALLTVGLVATSKKENEFRLAVHPRHLPDIDQDLRARLMLQEGYGTGFGVEGESLHHLVGAVRSREEVLRDADVVLLPKPTVADLKQMRPGQVVWGWPHAVQDVELTQVAVDKKLTLIAWEAMDHWGSGGEFMAHVFQRNNELAGYCSVLHALALRGVTGHFGRRLRAIVIGFGSTARGAVTALQALGVLDVTALTSRVVGAVADPMHGVVLEHMERSPEDQESAVVHLRERTLPIHEMLADFDVVVNCVLQDTDHPLMFVRHEDLPAFTPGTLIVDVSCDEGMGFEFARPTTFDDPTFTVGDAVVYYGVDHSPSYFWNSATWEISKAVIPHLRTVMSGNWDDDPTIARAIQIRDGAILNSKILAFQHRSGTYPHARN